MKRIGLALLALFVAILVIGPRFVGSTVEENYRQALAKMAYPLAYSLEVARYDRGWFSSRATTAITVAQQGLVAQEPVVILIEHDIAHGPLIMDSMGISFGLASYDTRFDFPDPTSVATDISDAITLYAHVGFWATEFQLDTPEVTVTSSDNVATIEAGSGTFDLKGRHLEGGFELPLISIRSDKNDVEIKQTTLAIDFESASELLWLGTGEWTFNIGEVAVTAPQQMAFRNFTMAANTKLHDGTFDTEGSYGLGGADLGPLGTVGESRFAVSLTGLDAAVAADMIRAFQNLPDLQSNPMQALTMVQDMMSRYLDMLGPNSRMASQVVLDLDLPDAKVKGHMDQSVWSDERGLNYGLQSNIDLDVPDEMKIDGLAIDVEVAGLDGQEIKRQYAETIRTIYSPEYLAQLGQTLPTDLTDPSKWLTANSALHIRTLDGAVNNHPFSAKANLGFAGDEALDLGNPMMLFPRLEADLTAQATLDLLAELFLPQLEGPIRAMYEQMGQEADEQAIKQLARQQLEATLSQQVAMGLLAQDGDGYSVDAALQFGRLTVNGVDRTELLMGLAGAAAQ